MDEGSFLRRIGEETWEAGRPQDTRRVFEAVALGEDLPDFLTEIAYELLP
jgi:malate synthase